MRTSRGGRGSKSPARTEVAVRLRFTGGGRDKQGWTAMDMVDGVEEERIGGRRKGELLLGVFGCVVLFISRARGDEPPVTLTRCCDRRKVNFYIFHRSDADPNLVLLVVLPHLFHPFLPSPSNHPPRSPSLVSHAQIHPIDPAALPRLPGLSFFLENNSPPPSFTYREAPLCRHHAYRRDLSIHMFVVIIPSVAGPPSVFEAYSNIGSDQHIAACPACPGLASHHRTSWHPLPGGTLSALQQTLYNCA